MIVQNLITYLHIKDKLMDHFLAYNLFPGIRNVYNKNVIPFVILWTQVIIIKFLIIIYIFNYQAHAKIFSIIFLIILFVGKCILQIN